MDVHGFSDNTVPANVTNGMKPKRKKASCTEDSTGRCVGPYDSAVSNDGFFYTPTPNVTAMWAENNDCDFKANLPFVPSPHTFENAAAKWEFSCNSPHGDCGGNDVVQCTWAGDHTWPFCPYNQYPCENMYYGVLAVDFMSNHPKPHEIL